MSDMRIGPIARVARHIVLMAGGVVMIAPFAIMSDIVQAAKRNYERDFHLFPEHWALNSELFRRYAKVRCSAIC